MPSAAADVKPPDLSRSCDNYMQAGRAYCAPCACGASAKVARTSAVHRVSVFRLLSCDPDRDCYCATAVCANAACSMVSFTCCGDSLTDDSFALAASNPDALFAAKISPFVREQRFSSELSSPIDMSEQPPVAAGFA
jgi:hypothetical protein